MVLRPVELDASGYPWSGQPHKGRLDHMVIIYEVIVVRLVQSALDTASKLRKYHDEQIIVLQIDGPVCHILLFVRYLFRHREGIDLTRTSLVSSVFNK